MPDADIIIVGAGAAGLAAASHLSRNGYAVLVLEGQNRLGGRIFTANKQGFSKAIETGAEFIHGELPVTLKLLKDAGIEAVEMEGETYRIKEGELVQTEELVDDMSALIKKMENLRTDMPLKNFLDEYFNDEKFEELRKSLKRLVEGYDAADISKVSTFSVKEELTGGGLNITFRPSGGYNKLIDFLADEIRNNGGVINLSNVVKDIFWKKGRVEVHCANGSRYSAHKVLITVSLGVLQCDDNKKAHIKITPEIPGKRQAFRMMEFGTVIKIFMQFKSPFWQDTSFNSRKMPDLGFLITDTPPITAWWTQSPDNIPILTAWMAGPNAQKISGQSDDAIFESTLELLVRNFKTSKNLVTDELTAKYIVNWATDPFACGAYAYNTVESPRARKILSEPVENTIYFAGEALDSGNSIGTVEAALSSGINTAKLILV